MERTSDTDKFIGALIPLILNSLVNNYAVERVAFGYEKPGDRAPIDLYLNHLNINIGNVRHKRSDIYGVYIDEQERISAEQDRAEYVRTLFVSQMERIFCNAPKDIRLEREGEEIPFLPRCRECLLGLLPLFADILNVEVEYTVFDLIQTDKAARKTGYPKWAKFVTSILLKPLRSGSQINRYVRDFADAPYYIRRLIEHRGKKYFLKPVDTSGCEYAFALFSLMQFMNGENIKLLELKMNEWERLHRQG